MNDLLAILGNSAVLDGGDGFFQSPR